MKTVIVEEKRISIPTYEVGEPNKNPMFLEKRVYQGSSGAVYPHPVIDKIHDKKTSKEYDVIFLENKYIKIMIMPSLGGRIQMAYDKINERHFIYYNSVIKPALVGLTGPWISGGIEFNWPQHHRPSTFDPVDYTIEENKDGSKTVWVSEIEKMFRTKGMAGFTLHPDKSYIEIKAKLYNRTNVPQTFLWWANPALAVNDDYQTVFPPDVHAVMDHGKRDVSRFPIATGEYYKMDYSNGVDISKYKNIPVPTSYMAYKSEYNFVGGYDHGKEAGMLHVCNHHISPGKKQWVWGCGDFGKAWDRNLTDEDGPYVELMTGVFTDNQPDFSWLQPFEEKTFTQYFMPYNKIGYVKNACKEGAINLDIIGENVRVGVYTTSEEKNLVVKLYDGFGNIYLEQTITSSPDNPFITDIPFDKIVDKNIKLEVYYPDGAEFLSYALVEESNIIEEVPDPAQAALEPQKIHTIEELYLTGLHLEQYRHATRNAEDYYREGIKRDPTDLRCNNALGLKLYRKGEFHQAEKYFRTAIKKITYRNPNPYDGEVYYNLGLALKMQKKTKAAYDAFFKACWNAGTQNVAYFQLALIATEEGRYCEALDLVTQSLIKNWHNHKARNLKTIILRKLNKLEDARKEALITISLDALDFASRNEMYKILQKQGKNEEANNTLVELNKLMRGNDNNYLELSLDYTQAGLYEDGIEIIERFLEFDLAYNNPNPLIIYHCAYYYQISGNISKAEELYKLASSSNPDYCFPNKLDSLLVLEAAILKNPSDSWALYYLGNMLYAFRRHDEAIKCWDESIKYNNSFPTAHRNLALALMNKHYDHEKCKYHLEKAFSLDTSDARVLYELDQFYKKQNYSIKNRLNNLIKHPEAVNERDDLYIEYIALTNIIGNYEEAFELIMKRKFHPWEGGEGKVSEQYKYSLIEMAKQAIDSGCYADAIKLLERGKIYPENLGEGKLYGCQENNINYYLGVAHDAMGDHYEALKAFKEASTGLSEPCSAIYYNDQPPHMIFYQGLAHLKLGDEKAAKSRFNKLIDYGEKHIFDTCEIDYFAVSLPDFLVFDKDINAQNRIHCRYMIALGFLGVGENLKAIKEFDNVLTSELSHMGATSHKPDFFDKTKQQIGNIFTLAE